MSQGRGGERRRGGSDERDDTVRAEDMEDRDSDTRGTTTERYTLTPPTNVVRGEVTRQDAPQEEVTMRQQTVRREPPLVGEREVDVPGDYALDQDRVRWPAVWAGLLAALTMLLALSVLGLAVGLSAIDAGQAVAQRGVPSGFGLGSSIWAGISAILAFLLGGWVAARTAAVFSKGWGALNGMLVFLLAVPLLLWLASSGIGALLGSLGGFAQSLNLDPNAVRNAAGQATGQAGQTAQNLTPAQAAAATTDARNAAWSTLLGIGLGLGAATLGGLLGTRSDVTVDRDDLAPAGERVAR